MARAIGEKRVVSLNAFVCDQRGTFAGRMKISFLIPTKNRLDLLKSAVSSILAQSDLEFEIIVSDNASQEDYSSFIDSLHDPRIIYRRLPEPVSVTRNWRNALTLSSGDYILMLGDDDALAPRFGEIVKPFLATAPDIIYLAAYHYAYPGALDFKPAGYLAVVRNSEFQTKAVDAFCLTKSYAKELAASVLDFRYRFGFNAQYFLLKSSFAKKFDERGGLYQSPYPDTFSAIVAFSQAQSIVVVPREAVIIGIAPNSFGAYYFSKQYKDGFRFLATEKEDIELRRSLEEVILPGDPNNTNWLISAEAAKRLIPSSANITVNIARYRALQMIAVLRERYLTRRISDQDVNHLRSKLSDQEALPFGLLKAAIAEASQVDEVVLSEMFASIDKALDQFVKAKIRFIDIGSHQTVDDAVAWLAREPEVLLNDDESSERAEKNLIGERAGLIATAIYQLQGILRPSFRGRLQADKTK